MDLWIRNQDRECLIKIENISIDNENWVLGNLVSDDNKAICDYWKLGHYKTKERALEVLDEIHGCIQTNAGFEMYSNLGQFSDDFNKKYNLVPVYLMPKE